MANDQNSLFAGVENVCPQCARVMETDNGNWGAVCSGCRVARDHEGRMWIYRESVYKRGAFDPYAGSWVPWDEDA
jgi:hypothetical protein